MSHYLVHVNIAAPGTPLKVDGGTSLPGHMFYVIEQGSKKISYGLAPAMHGQINGPGKVYENDFANYKDPLYIRTLEISKQQYDKLNAFGKNCEAYGFSKYYQDARNNCVDFTWAALNHAGLHATARQSNGRGGGVKTVPRPKHEGSLKPARNIDDVQSIQPPFPNSALNRETRNLMPKRDALQWLFSETQKPMVGHRV
jgi:hypothetical protein